MKRHHPDREGKPENWWRNCAGDQPIVSEVRWSLPFVKGHQESGYHLDKDGQPSCSLFIAVSLEPGYASAFQYAKVVQEILSSRFLHMGDAVSNPPRAVSLLRLISDHRDIHRSARRRASSPTETRSTSP